MSRPSITSKIMARTGAFYSSCAMLFKAHVEETPLALKKAWNAPDPASSVKVHFSRALRGRLFLNNQVLDSAHGLVNLSKNLFKDDDSFIEQRMRLHRFNAGMIRHIMKATIRSTFRGR